MRLKSLPPPSRRPSFLLSFDFDDTLYDERTEDKVPREFFDTVIRWRERYGVLWGINTGRGYDFLVEGYAGLAKAPFAPDFAITMERNIHLADEGLHLRPFTRWNDCCRDDHHALFARHRQDFDGLFLELEERFRHVGWWHQEEDEYSIEVEDPADLEDMTALIDGFLRRHPDISAQRAGPYLRFCHAEYNKGTALQEVALLLGMPETRVAVFGDGYNDVDTLRINVAAHCAAPANAVGELRALVAGRGGYVSPYPCGRGVMDALQEYCLPLIEAATDSPS